LNHVIIDTIHLGIDPELLKPKSFCREPFLNEQKTWPYMGGFLKWYPQNTPKLAFLVGKPMVVGYHHFRKHPYNLWMEKTCLCFSIYILDEAQTPKPE